MGGDTPLPGDGEILHSVQDDRRWGEACSGDRLGAVGRLVKTDGFILRIECSENFLFPYLVIAFLVYSSICMFFPFMLNLLVMMFAKTGVFMLGLLVGFPGWFGILAVNRPMITSPRPGEALQGVIAVQGSTDVLDFESAELSFAYQDGGEETWFLIANLKNPVEDQRLAEWDTTTIADGTYQLRLRVI